MKMLLATLFLLLPHLTGAQIADSTRFVVQADSLRHLSLQYFGEGRYPEVVPLLKAELDLRSAAQGTAHPAYVRTLSLIGTAYLEMRKIEEAIATFSEVRRLQEEIHGKENVLYAKIINSLGSSYASAGFYDQAEAYFNEAKNLWEGPLGTENVSYGNVLTNLGVMHRELGRIEQAEPLLRQALLFFQRIGAEDQGDYILTLAQLAVIYLETGRLDAAEKTILEALEKREKINGKQTREYADLLTTLSNVYEENGRMDEAAARCLEAADIYRQIFGSKHLGYAVVICNLANIYFDTPGREAEALALYTEAKVIFVHALGEEHYNVTATLNNMAIISWQLDRDEAAAEYFEQMSIIQRRMLGKSCFYLSTPELAQYTQVFKVGLDEGYSFSQQAEGEARTAASRTCYDNTLFYKGFLLYSANALRTLAQADSTTALQYEQLTELHGHLAAQLAQPLAAQQDVPSLEAQTAALEKDLRRKIVAFDRAVHQVTWTEVQAGLKQDEVAIEFVHHAFSLPRETDSVMYAALLLRPGTDAPVFVPLFEERELDALMKGVSGANFRKINALYTPDKVENAPQRLLQELVWGKIIPYLAGVKTVYCAATGQLHRLNLAAIASPETGRPIGDQFRIVLLNSTREITWPQRAAPTGPRSAYLLGGIRYQADEADLSAANLPYATRGPAEGDPEAALLTPEGHRGDTWQYLPGTLIEVAKVGAMLTRNNFRAELDTGALATEEAFKYRVKHHRPFLLHVATHGYFFPNPTDSSAEQDVAFKNAGHPLIRSGLLLAGAQKTWTTGQAPADREDGILTAYEISQLNLDGTELVVLSACETGLGDVVGNEGVYGLQRALKIAGAHYILLSLWKVNDQTTQEFMAEFYRCWLEKGLDIPSAFHQAQRTMRVKYPDDAYHWAGFELME